MKVVYSEDTPPLSFERSIFLAGPTPRSQEVPSWRPEALKILKSLNYDGVVFVPEYRDPSNSLSLEEQMSWELECLNMADIIVFWVPREIPDMPAFTTNVEFGYWVETGKTLLGHPYKAVHTKYLDHLYFVEEGRDHHRNLSGILGEAVSRIGEGSYREKGARKIPMHIWKTTHFQQWYQSVIANGNTLADAQVLWTFFVGKKFPFSFCIQANIWIESEQRSKTNEFVFTRPDVSSVVLYCRRKPDVEVVLVKEFRSPVRNPLGLCVEIPSGSSKEKNMKEVAAEELKEETGIDFPVHRFKSYGSRQGAATLSSHHYHLFGVEVTPIEMRDIKRNIQGRTFGKAEDTESTTVEVFQLQDLISRPVSVDWVTLGMIFQVLGSP